MSEYPGTEQSGPGLLFVNSKVTRPDILNLDAFFKWYDDEHIPEVVESSGFKGARRYIDVDQTVERRYLALYDCLDIAFRNSAEFATIKVDSPMLPGTGHCFDMADFDIRFYKLVHTYPASEVSTSAGSKGLMVVQIGPGQGVTDDELLDWYKNEHLDALSKISGYQGALILRLAFAGQNRNDAAHVTLPRPHPWLILHKWGTLQLDQKALDKTAETELAKKILSPAKVEVRMYEQHRRWDKTVEGKSNLAWSRV